MDRYVIWKKGREQGKKGKKRKIKEKGGKKEAKIQLKNFACDTHFKFRGGREFRELNKIVFFLGGGKEIKL